YGRSTGTAVARTPACASFNASWWQGDIRQSRCAAVAQPLLGNQAVQLPAVGAAKVAGRLTLVPKVARFVGALYRTRFPVRMATRSRGVSSSSSVRPRE